MAHFLHNAHLLFNGTISSILFTHSRGENDVKKLQGATVVNDSRSIDRTPLFVIFIFLLLRAD